MASRAISWWNPNTSGSVSTSSPLSTAARSRSMRWSSEVSVTAASTSNGTRRPSSDAAATMRRTSGSRSSYCERTSSLTVHGSGVSSTSQVGCAGDAAISSSRKNGLPPVRRCSASVVRNVGSSP